MRVIVFGIGCLEQPHEQKRRPRHSLTLRAVIYSPKLRASGGEQGAHSENGTNLRKRSLRRPAVPGTFGSSYRWMK
jgi:hypothetical protein